MMIDSLQALTLSAENGEQLNSSKMLNGQRLARRYKIPRFLWESLSLRILSRVTLEIVTFWQVLQPYPSDLTVSSTYSCFNKKMSSITTQ